MHRFSTTLLYYAPAIALESILDRKVKRRISAVLLLIITGLYGTYGYLAITGTSTDFGPLIGGTMMIVSVYATISMLRFFHNSYYFRGFHSLVGNNEPESGVSYEVARTLYRADGDVTGAFISSPQGYILLRRLGMSEEAIAEFVAAARPRQSVAALPLPTDHFITFRDLALTIWQHDETLRTTLSQLAITEALYLETVGWVTREYYRYKQAQRWWARDNLITLGTIGHGWSYGTAFLLERFSQPLANNSIFSTLITDGTYADEKRTEIEAILTREREANVILVGETGVGKLDIISRVAERVKRGEAEAALSDRRFVVLHTESLLAAFDTKQSFERTFLKLLTQAANAGNLALIIENLPGFITAGDSIGVDIPALIAPYFNASELNLVFTATPQRYHEQLERLGLQQRMSTVYIEPPSFLGTERLLEDIARSYEQRFNTVVTFPAIREIARSADSYIVTGVMPDKAIDLLDEITTAAGNKGIATITAEYVLTFVSQKTGIPVGPVQDEEREILMELEDRLHKRVVGQDAAITAISSALRRARAGIQDSNRPLGSFLFLGPTGVGKTETAKALATVFFGATDTMQRFDMSEFSGHDAVAHLIGGEGQSGLLANTMREHPYAVVLLDEFEKADRGVHDLFLQILDEGRFTDGRGQVVIMRNTIIIATSNAGSDVILSTVEHGEPIQEQYDEIIRLIIDRGIYRPELINRFDGTIIFEPLTREQQLVVARYLLEDLSMRLQKKGYVFSVTEPLIAFVAQAGYDPEFGARPMRRVIQDQIEEYIAQEIIKGTLAPGSTITIPPSTLRDLEKRFQTVT